MIVMGMRAKAQTETILYTFEFDRVLQYQETINGIISYWVTCQTDSSGYDIQIGNSGTVQGDTAFLTIGGGVPGQLYKVWCQVSTSLGQTPEACGYLIVLKSDF
jgi:hypothetical protein